MRCLRLLSLLIAALLAGARKAPSDGAFQCLVAGPCLLCDAAASAPPDLACKGTGHAQAIACTLTGSSTADLDAAAAALEVRRRRSPFASSALEEGSESGETGMRRALAATREVATLQRCSVPVSEETTTDVLRFEVGCCALGLVAGVVISRKRRAARVSRGGTAPASSPSSCL